MHLVLFLIISYIPHVIRWYLTLQISNVCCGDQIYSTLVHYITASGAISHVLTLSNLHLR